MTSSKRIQSFYSKENNVMLRGDKNKDEIKTSCWCLLKTCNVASFSCCITRNKHYGQSQCLPFKAYPVFPCCAPELTSLWTDMVWSLLWGEGCSFDNPFKSMLSHGFFSFLTKEEHVEGRSACSIVPASRDLCSPFLPSFQWLSALFELTYFAASYYQCLALRH